MSLFQYAWILTDDYGHDIDDHANYHDCDSHNNDDFIPEMFLGHVASLHTLGGDGFATQFEQVGKLNESFFNRNEKNNNNKLASLEDTRTSS